MNIRDQIAAARALADAAGAAEKLDGPVGELFRIGFATNGAAEMRRLCSSLERACDLIKAALPMLEVTQPHSVLTKGSHES